MIKIETEVYGHKKETYDIIMEYEQEDTQVGEYLAILDKIKKEVIENTNIKEKQLKEIMFEE